MLHVFFGNDTVGVRMAAHDFVDAEKQKGTAVSQIVPEVSTKETLVDLAGATSLFGGTELYVLDTPSEESEFFLLLQENLALLAESANTFVVIEQALLAKEKKLFTKHAVTAEEKKAEKEERFNTFRLTDALLARDKKSLWVLLMQAFKNGVSGEEIVGVLYWQTKMMELATVTNTAEEAGQKSFVYGKAKKAAGALGEGGAKRMSRELLTLYHDAHLGKRDLTIGLERWVLSL